MDMTPPNDFLPIPKCFSHLVISNIGDGESHRLKLEHVPRSGSFSFSVSLYSEVDSVHHSNTDSSDLRYVEMPFKSTKLNQSGNQCCFTKSSVTTESHTLLELDKDFSNENSKIGNSSDNTRPHVFEKYSSQIKENSADYKNPFIKLNVSLKKLQKEMKDLRFLDVSLFCQLMSLQDAIQDLKLTMSDRYSETGSEFSLGTASYMGSMSSLNEESDWGDEEQAEVFDQSRDTDFDASISETQDSASDLLKQISDLALRAEEDF
ncbi:hypothetical protein Btru_025591 [Bulinus truncatus]|nr:hypothetical protein Btru_025591 [Bulinus truncatus]